MLAGLAPCSIKNAISVMAGCSILSRSIWLTEFSKLLWDDWSILQIYVSKSLFVLNVGAVPAGAIWNYSDHISFCIMTAGTEQAAHLTSTLQGDYSEQVAHDWCGLQGLLHIVNGCLHAVNGLSFHFCSACATENI